MRLTGRKVQGAVRPVERLYIENHRQEGGAVSSVGKLPLRLTGRKVLVNSVLTIEKKRSV